MKQVVGVLCLLATLAVSIQVVKSQSIKDIKPICMNETGATEEHFKAYRKSGAARPRVVLCYVACVYKKFDVWTPENKMNMDNFKKIFSKLKVTAPDMYDIIIELSEKCNAQVKPDRDVCIAVNQTLNCLQEEGAKKFKPVVTEDLQQTCMNQTGITADDIQSYRKPGAIRTRGLLCYIACIYKKFDIFTSGNRINVENFKKLFSTLKATSSVTYNRLIKYATACSTEVNLDPDVCIAVNQTFNCMIQEAKVGTNLVLDSKP